MSPWVPQEAHLYLMELDNRLEALDVKYFRYMDDILILAPTRWKLRKAIRVMNQTFNELRLLQHPDKTMIGRTERDFDFLGFPGIFTGLMFLDFLLHSVDDFIFCFLAHSLASS